MNKEKSLAALEQMEKSLRDFEERSDLHWRGFLCCSIRQLADALRAIVEEEPEPKGVDREELAKLEYTALTKHMRFRTDWNELPQAQKDTYFVTADAAIAYFAPILQSIRERYAGIGAQAATRDAQQATKLDREELAKIIFDTIPGLQWDQVDIADKGDWLRAADAAIAYCLADRLESASSIPASSSTHPSPPRAEGPTP